jgi:hypothetical protein
MPLSLIGLYEELSEFILTDISRRIAKAGKITETAEFQIYRAQALGESNARIAEKIQEINKLSENELKLLYEDAARRSDQFDRMVLKQSKTAGVAFEDNDYLQRLIEAQYKATSGEMFNFTRTMGFAAVCADGKVKSEGLSDMLIKELDMAHLKVANGATDYNSAIRAAIKRLGDSGVRRIDFTSGRSERIESAVRRAVLGGTSKIANAISAQNAEAFGADGWEITAHSGARPSHAVYQGKQFPKEAYSTIVEPLINDYNCRHSAFPIIMGLSEPMHTDEELKNIDPKPFAYEGRNYNAYQVSEQQRYMEREMRKTKDRIICSEAAANEDEALLLRSRLARQREKYEDFSKTAKMYTQYERAQVYGFGRQQGARAAMVIKKFKELSGLSGLYFDDKHFITAISDHAVQRAMQRNLSARDIADALTNPMNKSKIKYDKKGRASVTYTGKTAEASINPETGNISTAWRIIEKSGN